MLFDELESMHQVCIDQTLDLSCLGPNIVYVWSQYDGANIEQ